MIYFVFALILAAAIFYMIFSEPRTSRAGLTHEAGEFLRLKERVKSIKASLKDIEYEKGVGKMDAENADRLTEELLAEWDILEPKIAEYEKIPHTTTPQCPQCGTTILSQAAKFCHACGSKLALLLLAVSLFLFTPRAILAYDIHVTVQNGTTEGVETTPLTIQLLRLSQGMEPVTTKKSAAGKASFTNLPEIGNAPYMLQTVYKGVAYNRVIAPNIPSPADVKLEVFDSTASTANIRVRTLVELRHTAKDELSGIMILFFLNSDRRAFVGGADGLEFALPENAKLEQASISVGSGSSNIQWLKLNPEKKTNGIYTVGQNVKPGDRVMQITFKMPYTQQKASLQFTPLYPQDTGLQLLVEPEDVLVRQGDKTLTRQHDKNLGRSLIAFNAAEKKVAFQLSGGGIAPVQATEEVEVVVTSPLSLTQKLLFPVVAVFVFVCALFVMTKRREN